eukprot:RCo046375
MEVDVAVGLVCTSSDTFLACGDERTVQFSCPPELLAEQFPTASLAFGLENVSLIRSAQELRPGSLSRAAQDFVQNSRNTVIYSYGDRYTPKKEFIFGASGDSGQPGVIHRTLQQVFGSADALPEEAVLKVHAYVLKADTSGSGVVDLLEPENTRAEVLELVKEGPTLNHVSSTTVRDLAAAVEVLNKVTQNLYFYFDSLPPSSLQLPPYSPDHVVFALLKYPTQEAAEAGVEVNSIHWVMLGDSERPALCGVSMERQNLYEATQR